MVKHWFPLKISFKPMHWFEGLPGAHGSRPGNQHRVGGARAGVSAIGAGTATSLRDFDLQMGFNGI